MISNLICGFFFSVHEAEDLIKLPNKEMTYDMAFDMSSQCFIVAAGKREHFDWNLTEG